MKKWWVKGLLGAVIWAVLVIGAGIVHTSVILGGRITEAEDEAISGKYGMACGLGTVGIFLFFYLFRNRAK